MVDHARVPTWFDDHLPCPSPATWLRRWVPEAGAVVAIDGRAPARLSALLDGLPRAQAHARAAVVAAPLHRPSPLRGPVRAQLEEVELVVDLAWVSSWGARVRLWGWRREPARAAVAARLGTVLGLVARRRSSGCASCRRRW
ncbi:MAG: hypothetical protein U0168_25560 [Nannocystaceae bacterium]